MKFLSWNSSSSTESIQMGPGIDAEPRISFADRLKAVYDRLPAAVRMLVKIVFYIFSGILIVVSFFTLLAINLAFSAASLAVSSVIYVVVGHAILRDAHLSGYAFPLHDSARQAAVGGAILAFPLAFALSVIFPAAEDQEGQEQLQETPLTRVHLDTIVQFAIGTAVGAATGPLGGTVLRHHGWKGVLDNVHAARAGALGGAIMGPGLLVALIVVVVVYKALPVEFGCWRQRVISQRG